MEDVLQSPNLTSLATGLFSREGGNDLLEARISKREQLKHAVARG